MTAWIIRDSNLRKLRENTNGKIKLPFFENKKDT